MEISVDQIHAYLHCPTKYKFEHVDKIQGQPDKSAMFKKALHQTISYFFLSAMGSHLPSLGQMKDKWASIWQDMTNASSSIENILLATSYAVAPTRGRTKERQPMDSQQIAGLEMIHNFYHFNKNNPGNVIAVDLEYRVPVGDVNVTGRFELIREIVDSSDGKRYIEIVDFKTGSDSIDAFTVKHDLNLTLASYAFRNAFHSTEDRLKYHYMKSGKDVITVRRENDFNRMKAIVSGVANGIQAKALYPRQTFMCKACPFVEMCDRVKF